MRRCRSLGDLAGRFAPVLLLLFALVACPAAASEPEAVVEAGPADAPNAPKASPEADQRPETALQRELRQILESESATVAELQRRFDAAADPLEALEVQRQIDRLKQSTEVRLLQVQAKHAREAGFAEQADRMERTAAEMATRIGLETPQVDASER